MNTKLSKLFGAGLAALAAVALAACSNHSAKPTVTPPSPAPLSALIARPTLVRKNQVYSYLWNCDKSRTAIVLARLERDEGWDTNTVIAGPAYLDPILTAEDKINRANFQGIYALRNKLGVSKLCKDGLMNPDYIFSGY